MAWLCLACSAEIDPADPRISDEKHPHHGGCPECGSHGIPADLAGRVSVSVTWHELRCLTMWAERWASGKDLDGSQKMLAVVYGIADRLQAQHLDQKVGLTFRSELAELSAAGFKYEQNVIRDDNA